MRETYIRGQMQFHDESERWTFHVGDRQPYGLHCGDLFEIKIGERYHPCRLEMASDWYVLFSGATLQLIRSQTYQVRM